MGDNFSVSFEYPTNLANAGVGTIVYLNAAGTLYEGFLGVIPAGSNPSAIVLSTSSAAGYARLLHSGNIPASVSGLSAGASSSVVADPVTGKLLRKASPSLSTSDWFCGYADTSGNVSFHKPFQFISGQSGRVALYVVTSTAATAFDCSEIDRQVVIVNSSGAAHSTIVTLPIGIPGRIVSIKDGTANAGAGYPTLVFGHAVNIEQFSGSSTYAASLTLSQSSASWDLIFDGTNWRLI